MNRLFGSPLFFPSRLISLWRLARVLIFPFLFLFLFLFLSWFLCGVFDPVVLPPRWRVFSLPIVCIYYTHVSSR
jgi:hypothetical protein